MKKNLIIDDATLTWCDKIQIIKAWLPNFVGEHFYFWYSVSLKY